MVSEQILLDLSEAYSPDEILSIIGLDNFDLVVLLYDKIEEHINEFQLRPVDYNEF
jgi:hypothetical protein